MAEFRVLGPVEASVDGEPIALPAAKPRALLAALLLERNRVVPVSRLIDDLWGEVPPETAMKALQGYVSQLRKAIGPERLLTRPPGYELRVEDGELDLDRFERLAREGRELLAAGDSKAAAKRLGEALELWRGAPLAEFSEPFARDAGARLEDERLAALALTAGGSAGKNSSASAELRSFVDKLENFLVQSQDGRRTVAAAVGGASRCTLSPSAAVTRLNQVQRNRQSLLQQAAALAVPNTEQALRASDLLQQSIHASFTADGHYSDWLAGRKRCGGPGKSPELTAALAADAQATRTKRKVVAVFNPLARRFDRRTWAADEF